MTNRVDFLSNLNIKILFHASRGSYPGRFTLCVIIVSTWPFQNERTIAFYMQWLAFCTGKHINLQIIHFTFVSGSIRLRALFVGFKTFPLKDFNQQHKKLNSSYLLGQKESLRVSIITQNTLNPNNISPPRKQKVKPLSIAVGGTSILHC